MFVWVLSQSKEREYLMRNFFWRFIRAYVFLLGVICLIAGVARMTTGNYWHAAFDIGVGTYLIVAMTWLWKRMNIERWLLSSWMVWVWSLGRQVYSVHLGRNYWHNDRSNRWWHVFTHSLLLRRRTGKRHHSHMVQQIHDRRNWNDLWISTKLLGRNVVYCMYAASSRKGSSMIHDRVPCKEVNT